MSANDGEQLGDSFQGFAPSGSTLCPGCDYNLRGLPLEYNCPECGLAYDRETMVWIGKPNRQYYFVLLSSASFLLLYAFLVINGRGYIGWRGMLITMIFAIGSVLAALKLVRQRYKRPILAIAPDVVIHSIDGDTRRAHIKWNRIHEIEHGVKRHGLATYQFTITYFHLKSIYITPFADSNHERYELLAIVEDYRRKRLGLEPREK